MNNGLFGIPRRQPEAVVRIAEITTSATQSTIEFSGIPQRFRDLEVRLRGRGTAASGGVYVQLRFNGDSGANYDYLLWNRYVTDAAVAASLLRVGELPAATAPAGAVGCVDVVVANYKETLFQKTVLSRAAFKIGTATTDMIFDDVSGLWRSSAAIQSLAFTLSAGSFVDGSVATIYGRT